MSYDSLSMVVDDTLAAHSFLCELSHDITGEKKRPYRRFQR